jgi:hypothetical protein
MQRGANRGARLFDGFEDATVKRERGEADRQEAVPAVRRHDHAEGFAIHFDGDRLDTGWSGNDLVLHETCLHRVPKQGNRAFSGTVRRGCDGG